MIEIRKTIILRETVFSELGVEANRPEEGLQAHCENQPSVHGQLAGIIQEEGEA